MADLQDDVVLSIKGMSKSFGRNRVLDHIDLEVRRGTQVHHDEVPVWHLSKR